MKLKEFIPFVLLQIEEGLNDERLKGKYAKVKPFGEEGGVEFDLAVVATEESSGKIGAEVLSIGAKVEGKVSNERISRVKFRVNYSHKLQDEKNFKWEVLSHKQPNQGL